MGYWAGRPRSVDWNELAFASPKGYHLNNSRESREREAAPGSGVWDLALGLTFLVTPS